MVHKTLRYIGMFLMGLTVALSFFFQGSFFQQEQHVAEVTLAIAFILWWSGFRPEHRRIAFFSSWIEMSMLAILCLYVITSFTALFPQGHVNVILQWMGGLLLFYAVREEAKCDSRWGTWISWMLIAASLGVVLLGLAAYVGIDVGLKADNLMSDKNRFASTLEYANTYAIYALSMWVILIGLSFSAKRKFLMLPLAGIVGYLFCVTFLLAASRGSFLVVPLALIGLIFALPRGQRVAGAAFFIGTMIVGFLTVKGIDGNAALADWGRVWKWLIVGCISGALGGAGIFLWMIIQRRWRIVLTSVIAVGILSIGLIYASNLGSLANKISSQQLQRLGNITTNDINAFLRIEFYRDALQIISDHPIVGSGGDGWSRLYHEYQRFFYIANVTHNHFLQIAVELGIVGLLLFVFFWYSLIACLRRAHSTTMSRVLTVAVLVIGIHSVIDFDLSFYSMLLLVFMVAGIASAQLPPFRWSFDRFQVWSVGLAALLILLAAPQAVGDFDFQAGKNELEQGRKAEAAVHFSRAVTLLPLDPQPHVQLARAKIGTEDQLAQLRLAQKLDPHNADWPHELSLALGYYEKWDEAYQESAKAIQLQPAKLDYYESTLDFGVQSVINGFLSDGVISKSAVTINAQIADHLIQYQQTAKEFKRFVPAGYQDSSTLLSLRAGQALALAGKYEEAVPFFKLSRKTTTLIPESEIWLYLTYQQLQNKDGQKELSSRPWIIFLPDNPISTILEKG